MMSRRKFNPNLLPERPNLDFEDALWRKGIAWVAGVDEAGRGALAGPVAAGAVVLPRDQPELMLKLWGVRDSKVMSAKERELWAAEIKAASLAWSVGMASPDEIDAVGIVPATCLAVSRAMANLAITPEHVLVDYLTLPEVICPQTPLIKGDARSLSVAAAAILAKTARDAVLIELDQSFPGYSFAKNKGYGTAAHRQAIAAKGPCSQHRRTFSPVSAYDSFFPPQIETN
jgi:ribonuclease HII